MTTGATGSFTFHILGGGLAVSEGRSLCDPLAEGIMLDNAGNDARNLAKEISPYRPTHDRTGKLFNERLFRRVFEASLHSCRSQPYQSVYQVLVQYSSTSLYVLQNSCDKVPYTSTLSTPSPQSLPGQLGQHAHEGQWMYPMIHGLHLPLVP